MTFASAKKFALMSTFFAAYVAYPCLAIETPTDSILGGLEAAGVSKVQLTARQQTRLPFRAFAADLKGMGANDLIYVNRAQNSMTVCFGGKPNNCATYAAPAADLIPVQSLTRRGHELLAVLPDGTLSSCNIHNSRDFTCSNVGIENVVAQGRKTAAGQNFLLAFDSAAGQFSCGTKTSGVTQCSGVRDFTEGNRGLFLGNFDGTDAVGMLSIQGRNAKYCRATPAPSECKAVAGLEMLESAESVALVNTFTTGRTTLVAIVGDSILVCAKRRLEASQEVLFLCEKEIVGEGLRTLTPKILPRYGKIVSEVVAFIDSRASIGKIVDDGDEPTKSVARRATVGADVAGKRLVKELELISNQPARDARRMTLIDTVTGDPLGTESPIFTSFDTDEFGGLFSFWSDIFGIYGVDQWAKPCLPVPVCLIDCGIERIDNQRVCEGSQLLVGGIVLAVTGAVTVKASSLGPWSLAVGAGTAYELSPLIGGVYTACNNMMDVVRESCRADCHARVNCP